MNPRLKRYYGAGDLHFITCSCYRREPLLGTANQRDLFLVVLEHVRRRYQFVVAGYVVMPEHIHLLIGEPQVKTPSTVMQALKIGFARRVSAQNHAPQHIWQKRFYDFNVWTEHKRIDKLRYMHQNPVKRGLVVSPELWPWSSFRAYALGEAGPVRVNGREVLKLKCSATRCVNQSPVVASGVVAPSRKAREGAHPHSCCPVTFEKMATRRDTAELPHSSQMTV